MAIRILGNSNLTNPGQICELKYKRLCYLILHVGTIKFNIGGALVSIIIIISNR